jgi:antitoxin ParD1/3/4
MAQMNISLPDGLKDWADARVAEGRFASMSDYVRDLMRRDQEYAEKLAWLRNEIEKGRRSKPSDRSLEEIMADARARVGGN